MTNRLSRMIKQVREVFLLTTALDNAANSKNEEAWSRLAKIYDLFGGQIPSASAQIDANMLCAHVSQQLGEYGRATEAAKMALWQIDESTSYSELERDYLRYYCKLILEYCEFKMNSVNSDAKSIEVRFSDLQFDKVRGFVKRHFPVTRPVVPEQGQPV